MQGPTENRQGEWALWINIKIKIKIIIIIIIIIIYYMALSHKDWELPNSQIWSAEINIESSLDFPIETAF